MVYRWWLAVRSLSLTEINIFIFLAISTLNEKLSDFCPSVLEFLYFCRRFSGDGRDADIPHLLNP
jgi:hypothetical protein